jgi:chromosomal replication initiation ATPase DnaA
MFLDFEWNEDYKSESFIIENCNSRLYKWVMSPQFWPKKQTLLIGPRYSGKTHLANIWQQTNNAIPFNLGSDLELNSYLIIDEVDDYQEDELLKIFDNAELLNITILWSSRTYPDSLNLFNSDIITRLKSVSIMQIEEPSENLFKLIIKKRCHDLGLPITEECLAYAVRYLSITYDAIHNIVEKLHINCLIQQRIPSIPLLSDILSVYRYNGIDMK